MSEYPHRSGDVIVIGPQCIATVDEQVINWKGTNYVPQGDNPDGAVTERLWFNPRREAVVLTERATGMRRWYSVTRPHGADVREGDEWHRIDEQPGPRRWLDWLRQPPHDSVAYDPATHSALRLPRP